MCLVIFAHRVSAELPLVVAANRDEFHARPTAPASFWPARPNLLAGRDQQAGGTWMGITGSGRFAAITNVQDPSRTAPAPRSRGELTLDFLTGAKPAEDYLAQIATRADDYAGFNLLLGSGDQLWFLNSQDRTSKQLAPGIYGLSNANLDVPWPKVELGKQELAKLMPQLDGQQPLPWDSLAKVVGGTELAKPEELHRQGLTGEMDQQLSAQFISAGSYGTRCTTTIVRSLTSVAFRETSFDAKGHTTGVVKETLPL